MNVIGRWIDENPEQGHYAAFAGFEQAIRAHSDLMAEAYDKLDVYEQIELFGFVAKLLEAEERP